MTQSKLLLNVVSLFFFLFKFIYNVSSYFGELYKPQSHIFLSQKQSTSTVYVYSFRFSLISILACRFSLPATLLIASTSESKRLGL